jgi:hypothetical protein
MAILHNGLFGDYTGKLGNTVAYRVLNKTVVRMIGKATQAPSEKQLANRLGMAVVNRFLKPVNQFINVGFALEAAAANVYPQNKAVSVIKRNALTGTYPDIVINYERVLLSMGDLPGLTDPEMKFENGALKFTWEPGATLEWSRRDDRLMLMAYFPGVDGQAKACFTLSGAKRQEGVDVLELPPALLDQRMEVYLAVCAANGKRISKSQYLGRLN